MQKQRKSSQETIAATKQPPSSSSRDRQSRVLVIPQGIYRTIWYLVWVTLVETKASSLPLPSREEGGNYILNAKIPDWLEPEDDWDSWNTTFLSHNQPIRRKSCTLQPLGTLGLLNLSCLCMDSLLGTFKKCHTFLTTTLVSVNGFVVWQVSGPKFSLVTVQGYLFSVVSPVYLCSPQSLKNSQIKGWVPRSSVP